ncbi:DNA cytosine methyltransferase [Streptococcus oralis]|uniref:DNA cytosine methyltransferase n=1 Tax=Streptococcus oralis TaxID=1303 RepID=UPI0019D1AA8F|nr:DNA cytosine methyltransferase [Streptococcus oralis]MBN6013748.1 DNA cytosine methyltransferase [Streptococcus oralis subsp. oralis]
MNIIDLFSGAGGLTEGFRSQDFNILCHIEKNKDACETLKIREAYYFLKKYNKLHHYRKYLNGRISKEELLNTVPSEKINSILNVEINEDSLEEIFNFIDSKSDRVDGIIGGPPCQAYSTIGRAVNEKKKNSDDRIYLYKYYLSFLNKYSPKFFIFENVKGLQSFKDVDGLLLLPKIKSEFRNAGYIISDKVINSSDYGVSQNRERLFIFGLRNDVKLDKTFFDELEKLKEKPLNLEKLFNDLPSINAGEEGYNYRAIRLSYEKKKYYRNLDEKIPLTLHLARPQTSNDLKIYKIVQEAKQSGRNIKYSELPSELQNHSNKDSFLDRFKALDENSYSHTVVAHISKDGHYYIHPSMGQTRSITVREAARIQSFPDNYYFQNSRTAAFVQIGNAVPPILSKKIADTVTKLF